MILLKAFDSDSLVQNLGELLSNQGLTLALAESCTGGMIAARITDVPGSSAYFNGGVVSYHNGVKYKILGVSEKDLTRYGAVSRQVALSMATGVKELLETDIALSVTGIAGPGGGSRDKPVGLVYMAINGPWGTQTRKLHFHGNRLEIRTKATSTALELIYMYLKNKGLLEFPTE